MGFPGGSDAKEFACNAGDPQGVQSLGQEDPLKKEMATHSSILAWGNPMNRGATHTLTLTCTDTPITLPFPL